MSTNVTVAFPRSHRMSVTRRALMLSCATLAVATAVLAPQKARAQAFNGSATTSTGVDVPSLSTSTIVVNNSTATINWTANSNDFLPVNTTATFTSSVGVTDYTVLNRIVPADANNPIMLNGNVISTLEGSSTIGGNIWFYAPSGILVGSSATFDVGGLLLTSLTPTLNSNNANGFAASFAKQTGDGGTITILSGAQINAYNSLTNNNYIALVAPRIVQGGDVRVNGSLAYAAAERLSLTMNQGLFDVAFDWQNDGGTSDANGIVHSGTTTGLAGNGKMYLMAMPKNQAITMLIGGTIGYDATNANVVNGQIVLSSGVLRINDIAPGVGITILDSDAGISIDDAHFLSPVQAYANRNIAVTTVAGNVLFDGDLSMTSFYGGTLSMITDGGSITVGGNAFLYASPVNFFFDDGDSDDRVGGNIEVSAVNDGTIVTNSLTLNVNGEGEDNGGGGDTLGGDGQGGNISLDAADGGSITVNGNLTAEAKGIGGDMRAGATAGGNGTGGDIDIFTDGGTIDVTGNLSLDAGGWGGTIYDFYNPGATTGTGGVGQGGNVDLHSDGTDGAIAVIGSSDLFADGYGGDGQTGGEGYGGTASVIAEDGTIDLGTSFGLFARGFGGAASYGFGGDGGYGQGGRASIEARAYPFTELLVEPIGKITGGDGVVDASGTGGVGGASNSDNPAGAGGDGQGGGTCGGDCNGGAYVTAEVDGATLDLGNVSVLSDGIGGAGGTGGNGLIGGTGGDGYGGAAFLGSVNPYETLLPTGSLNFASVEAHTQGVGGGGGNSTAGTGGLGGDGTAGTTSMVVSVTASTGELNLRASGFGGNGGNGVDGGDAGDAFAGSSTLTIDGNGSLTAGDVRVIARGFAGDGGNGTTGFGGDGGDATGGSSILTIAEGGLLTAASYFGIGHAPGGYEFDLNGDPVIDPETGLQASLGGNGGHGDSGDGAGGDSESGGNSLLGSEVSATIDGTAAIEGNFIVTTYAQGGDGSSGGNAYAGSSSITVNSGGKLTAGGTVQASAQAFGGLGTESSGGYAQGGSALIQVYGTLDAGRINVLSRAFGANGVTAGGEALGGTSHLYSDGLAVTSATDTMFISADAVGGNASDGNGGDATAGVAFLGVTGTVDVTAGVDILVTADAVGGDGVTGGDAYVGDAEIYAYGDGQTDGGTISAARSITVASRTTGGNGTTGNGGNAYGYNAELVTGINADTLTVHSGTGTMLVSTEAKGGDSDSGLGGDATGGTSYVTASFGGVVDADTLLDVSAEAIAGNGSAFGAETGGTVTLSEFDGTGTITAQSVRVVTGTFAGLYDFNAVNFTLVVEGDYDFSDYSIVGDLSVETNGNLTVDLVDAGTTSFKSGANLTTNDVNSGGLATFFAQGNATFTGTVSATEIKVTSGDIDIQAGANLGLNGVTTLITLEPLNLSDILIGGVDNPDSSWQLSEAGFINADAIVVDTLYGNNVIVDDFVIEGSQTLGGGVSSVTLNTDGTVKIIGAVEFINAGAGDVLAINSGETIQVVTDAGGSISMLDANGDLAGTLELTAHDIWIADQAVIDQLEIDPNYAGRDADLAANGGAVAPDGYIGADGVEVTMLGSSFLVQNSGTATDFAGISVGDGGLTIVNQGSEPATITAYGQQIQSNGTVVSGDEFANSVQTTGPVASGSTVNGCEIGVVCGAVTPPPVTPPPVTPPPVTPPPVTPPPVTPPPVTPPPVTPPPVTPPPVTPPPVTPPPVTPPPVTPPPPPPPPIQGAESILGPVGLMGSPSDVAAGGDPLAIIDDATSEEEEKDEATEESTDESVDSSLGLINSGPMNVDKPIEEPVTSGSDGVTGDPDDIE